MLREIRSTEIPPRLVPGRLTRMLLARALGPKGIATLILGLSLSSPAGAITNGTLDTAHPYAGAVIFDFPFPQVLPVPLPESEIHWASGVLVSPRVFVTAGHVLRNAELIANNLGPGTVPIDKIHVSFAPNILDDRKSWVSVESYAVFLRFSPAGQSFYDDVAVVILAKPVRDVTPGTLAPLGFLDDLKAAGQLSPGTIFSVLGYGMNEKFELTGDRRVASMEFQTMGDPFLVLHRIAGMGICFFDSGGPVLLNSGGTEYVVANTTIGLSGLGHAANTCEEQLNGHYRSDLATGHDFIQAAIDSNQ